LEILNGGSSGRYFPNEWQRVYNLSGGAGDDRFVFSDGASLSGTLDGGMGLDTLDFTAYTSAISVQLIAFTSEGYSGTQSALSQGFTGIDSLKAPDIDGVNGDRLYGVAYLAGQWILDGLNSSYRAEGAESGLNFTGFGLLYGGNKDDLFILTGQESGRLFGGLGNDTFRLLDGAGLTGNIDGGGGVNTLDYSDYTTSVYINLSTFTATNISTSVVGIHNIYGGQSNDTLIGDSGDNVLAGNGGNDRLEGGLGDDIYLFADNFGRDTVIDTANSDTNTLDFSGVTADLHFITGSYQVVSGLNIVTYGSKSEGFLSLIQYFIGGTGNDTFSFDPDNELPLGTVIDGGEGSDTLDYSAYSTPVQVNLAAGTATGQFTYLHMENALGGIGDDILIGNQEDNILSGGMGNDKLTGNGGNDTLDGGGGDDTYYFGDNWGSDTLDDADGLDTLDFSALTTDLIFTINTNNLVVTDGISALTTAQNTLERLLGGQGSDSFVFGDGAQLAGGGEGTFLDGGQGSNTLDYSAYTTGVEINLSQGLAAGVEQISFIQNVIGGQGNDILTGDDSDNILRGGAGGDELYGLGGNDTLEGGTGDDLLAGGAGDDSYVFTANWGEDSIVEEAGQGSDTLDFSLITDNLAFTFDLHSLTVSDGTSTFTSGGEHLENFVAGSGDDLFRFLDGAQITGLIDGQAGYNTLDFSASNTERHFVLISLGTITGFGGTAGGLGLGFNNISKVIGSSTSSDSLTGLNAQSWFNLSAYQYISGNTLDFSGFEILQGGTAADTFIFTDSTDFAGTILGGAGSDSLDYSGCTLAVTINLQTWQATGLSGTFGEIENLVGGSGSDTLIGPDSGAIFALTGSGSGLVNAFSFTSLENLQGGSGSDTLSYHNYETAVTLDLENGTASGLNSFTGIENFIGSIFDSDVLKGRESGSSFILTGADSGQVDGLAFASFENLKGGSGDDIFLLSGAGYLSGSIDGGSGENTLDYSAYTAGGIQVILGSPVNSGTATALGGVFANITQLVGTYFDDTLTGPDTDTRLEINGQNSGAISGNSGGSGSLRFSGIENLQAGNGNDTFAFSGSGCLSGSLDGGGGENTLDYSGYTAGGIQVTLGSLAYSGTATALGGSFSSIAFLIGSSLLDILTGPDSGATFNINGDNAGTITTVNSSFGFSGVETLIGGSGNDTFAFSGDGALSGSVHGGAGIDTLDYSAYHHQGDGVSGVSIDLLTGKATGINNGAENSMSGIENLLGSAWNDLLSGDNQNNIIDGRAGDDEIYGLDGDDILSGGSGNDILDGGAGNDTYVLEDGFGRDTVVENANNGSDTLDMSAVTESLLFIIDDTGLRVETINIPLTHILIHNGGQIENLVGGKADDTFRFLGSAFLPGTIDGREGSNTLDYSGYLSGRTVTLTGWGTLNGFAGIDSSALNSLLAFDNIETLLGSNAGGNTLCGLDSDSTYRLTGPAEGTYQNGERSLSFAAIERLAGGSGHDILDLSGLASGRDITLSGVDNDGFSGSEIYLPGGFAGINELIGSAALDTFTGLDQGATFEIADTVIYRCHTFRPPPARTGELKGRQRR
jgi:Ca2+-binding RTX toxin-like protein